MKMQYIKDRNQLCSVILKFNQWRNTQGFVDKGGKWFHLDWTGTLLSALHFILLHPIVLFNYTVLFNILP